MKEYLQIIALCLAYAAGFFMLGWLWPRSGRIKNTKKHTTADAEYFVVYINGQPHALTQEQVDVGFYRAVRLDLK